MEGHNDFFEFLEKWNTLYLSYRLISPNKLAELCSIKFAIIIFIHHVKIRLQEVSVAIQCFW